MGQQLLKRIEEFRKKQNLPILTLCKMMDVHNVTYHRWRNAGKITGAYHKIVEAFLLKNDKSAPGAVNNLSNSSFEKKTSDIAVVGMAEQIKNSICLLGVIFNLCMARRLR